MSDTSKPNPSIFPQSFVGSPTSRTSMPASSRRTPVPPWRPTIVPKPQDQPVAADPAPAVADAASATERPQARLAPQARQPPRITPGADTLRGLILDVAHKLPQPFHKNALVVACWTEHPQRFALTGYPQYPDSNKVWSKLSELASCQLIEPTGNGSYRVKGKSRPRRKPIGADAAATAVVGAESVPTTE